MNTGLKDLRERMLPVPEGNYLLGLSGGADSVALLLMMVQDLREGRIGLQAIHVNHGLRGQESDADELFCRELCQREGVILHICRADLRGRRDEATAREERFRLFREKMEECGADALMTAHHADDQAETFLMRLMRGTGPNGLACMNSDETVFGIRVFRPMLTLRRGEIRAALSSGGTAWREDSTNLDNGYLRNRIRQELIPAMEQIGKDFVRNICLTASLLREDNEALDQHAVQAYSEARKGAGLRTAGLAAEAPAIRSRVLRMFWRDAVPERKEHSLSAAQTARLESLLCAERGKITLPGEIYAIKTEGILFLTGVQPAEMPEAVSANGPECRFGEFILTETESEGSPGDGKTAQEVPPGFIWGCVIRTRRNGDRIRPFGCSGSRKLQDYLTDRHIPEPYRNRIPLLCRDQEVLLVCGVGAGNVPEWNGEEQQVRLTWHGPMPWMEE